MKSFSLGDSSEMADELLELVLAGKKSATTGAVTNDSSPDEVGEQIALLDSKGNPRAVIEITEVTRLAFKDVDATIAHDEGEGDQSLEYWRLSHKEFFTREGTYNDDMEVVCERFKLIEVISPNRESESLKLARSYLGKEVEVTFDRPLGSKHPKHGFVYEVNYGFVDGIKAPDGEDLDAYYLGVDEPLQKATGVCIAIVHRTNDDDDKLVVVPAETEMTDAEILKLVHFQEQWFEHEIIRS